MPSCTICHFSSGDRSTRGFLPILPPCWRPRSYLSRLSSFRGEHYKWTWNPVYTAYDSEYVQGKYKYVEPGTGRYYRLDNLTGPGGAAKGNPSYEVMGITRYWRYSKTKMESLVNEGRIIQTKPGTVPQFKRYLDEMPGLPLQDVWTDIDPINSQAQERLHYPTQKPEALLERILISSSKV